MKKIALGIFLVNCITTVIADELLDLANEKMATKGEYYFYYNGDSLKNALRNYANNKGLAIDFSNNILAKLQKTKLQGRIQVDESSKLLDTLAKQYGFQWFIYSGHLYITNNTQTNKSIEVSAENISIIKDNLKQIGLLDSRFGFTELTAENKVIISGPDKYVNMLVNQIRSLNVSPSSQQFAVYRLKYASALDTQVTFNNQKIIVPGIATILQAIIQKQFDINKNHNNRLVNQTIEPIKNEIKNNIDKLSINEDNDNRGRVSTNAIIQADSRLNTIVIRDKTANLRIYKNLIELLDVPSPLIQVEVLVIHLDEDQLNQQGINWWASSNGSAFGFGGANLTNQRPDNSLSLYFGQVNPGQLLVNNLNNFLVGLQFLERKNLAKVVGRPSIATTDNLPAIVNVVENLYLNNGGLNQNNTANSTTTQAQAITSLEITPHVIFTDDNQKRNIKLAINLQDGNLSSQTTPNTMPTSTQSAISSQAVIQEGQSLLLAGYTRDTSQTVNTQVPFLGSIPIIGWFFRSTAIRNRKIGTLYLVTPKVIWLGDMVKLDNYVELGNKKFDINSTYKLISKPETSTKKDDLR